MQQPELNISLSRFESTQLAPERSNHFRALVEQSLPGRVRIRAEVFHRWDRDLVARSLVEPRFEDGEFLSPFFAAPFGNSLRAYTRGFHVWVQRRSSNGLTGWASYSWAESETRDGVLNVRYPSGFDQLHTITAFGS